MVKLGIGKIGKSGKIALVQITLAYVAIAPDTATNAAIAMSTGGMFVGPSRSCTLLNALMLNFSTPC